MGALVVERAGAGVVVRSADSRVPPPRLPAKITSADDGRVRVFVDHAALGEFDLLDGRVLAELEAQLRPGQGSRIPDIRLLAGRAGLAGVNGQAPLAARLSERLNVEVVAPDGNLLMLPGGELFSQGDAAGWVGFRPGRHKIHSGPRHPGPVWQDELTEALRRTPADPRIAVATIPAGLWVRSAGKPPRPATDVAFRVPVSGSRPAIVVGAPGEEPPEVMALAGLIASLPPRLRETSALIGYGPEPVATSSWAQRIADILGIPVNGCHALPQYLPDGNKTWQALDGTGEPTWRPFVLESTYRPGTPPIPRNYVPPVSGMTEVGTGTYWFQDGWLLDMLPSGMLVRPMRTTADPVAVRLVPDPDAVNLVVTGADGPPPAPVLKAIERLATALAPEVRARLRLVATPHWDPGILAPLAEWLNVGVHVLGVSGPGPAVFPPAPSNGEARSPGAPSGEVEQPTHRLSPVPVQPPADQQTPAGPEPRTLPPAPVEVDTEGRMRPIGDGWRRDDAAATKTPAVKGDAAPGGSRPAALPVTSASVRVPTVASTAAPGGGSAVATAKLPEPVTASAAPAAGAAPTATEQPAVPVADAAVMKTMKLSASPAFPVAPAPPAPAALPAAPATPPAPPAPVTPPAMPAAPAVPPAAAAPAAPAVLPAAAVPPAPAAPAAPAAPPAAVMPPAPSAPAAPLAPAAAVVPPAPAAHAAPLAPAAAVMPPAPLAPAAPAVPSAPAAPAALAAPPPPPAAAAPAPVDSPTQRLKPVAAGPEGTARSAASAVRATSAAQVPVASVATATELAPKATPATTPARPENAAPATEKPAQAAAEPSAAAPAPAQPGPAPQVAAQRPAQPAAAANPAQQAAELAPAAAGPSAAAAEPAGAAAEGAARRGQPLLLTDHASTEGDRLQFRKSLGWRYDAATQSVSRLLAERPGLRGGAAIDDAMMTELAAIHVFATSDQAEVIEAFRSGAASRHYPFISCLAGGLRRLPSVQGLVVRGGPEIGAGAGDYAVGADLLEPAPLMGVADAAAPVPGGVEVLVWSVTGRRIGGLADGTRASDVMFLPATVFRVLAVETGTASPRVLLTEIGLGRQRSPEAQQRYDAKILARLREAAENREDVPGGEFSDEDRARHAVLPGSPANPFAIPEIGGVR
ncbi:hypothetical protein ACWEV3_25175 [Saccharopolyspora sp. NPDC003752]